jgi:hypothetical protein
VLLLLLLTHLVAHLRCSCTLERLDGSVVLHAQLEAVIQVEVVQATQCEVVWALLAVRAQHKHTAVGLVAEELQGSFTASFKWFDVGVLAAEGMSVKLYDGDM